MSRLLLLTDAPQPTTEVLPSLALLAHEVTALPASATALLSAPECDAIIVDGRGDLEAVRSLCQLIQTTGVGVPVLLVMTEGGLVTASIEWGVAEVLLATAGPAEVEARLRLGAERLTSAPEEADGRTVIRGGELEIDESSYTARLGAQKLDLTFKEFELVRHLAQHPGRVFTREQLLQEVWGHDYFGGTRTVDVHVRRLRAKLGPEHEALIGTVRNVGYRFVVPTPANSSPDGPHGGRPSDGPHGGRTSDRPTDPTSDPTSDRTSERAAHQ